MPTRSFVALFRDERLVAVSSEPEIVARFIRELTGEVEDAEERYESEQREPLRLVPGRDED